MSKLGLETLAKGEMPEIPDVDAGNEVRERRDVSPLKLAAAGEIAFLLVMPVLAFFCLHFEPIQQSGTLDPYIYTGYINNFHDLWLRYGVTYYGVRFGLILPARASVLLFGPIAGYFVLRYFLALIFAVPLYLVSKQYLSRPVAIIVYVTALASPFVARTLLWDHSDASGVPFLYAAICLLLMGRRLANLTSWLAGFFLGFAGNSNVFTIAVFTIFLVVYVVLWRALGGDWSLVFRRVFIAACGALVVTAAGSLYYWHATGVWNIFRITLAVASKLSTGGMQRWRTPGVAWTLDSFYVYVPVWLSACCAVALASAKKTFRAAVITCFGATLTVFYYVHQFLLGADTLQLFYYFSYAAGAIFLLLAVAYQRLWAVGALPAAWFVGVACFATAVPWFLLSWGWDPLAHNNVVVFAVLAGGASVLWVAILRKKRSHSIRLLTAAATLLFGLAYDAGLSYYASMIHPRTDPSHTEMDVYRVALQLIREMPELKNSGPVLFWYNNRSGTLINSVQSTYLWEYSRLSGSDSRDAGMPVLTLSQIARLNVTPYLVLLGESQEEVDKGIQALASHGLPYREVNHEVLAAGNYKVYWDLVRFDRR